MTNKLRSNSFAAGFLLLFFIVGCSKSDDDDSGFKRTEVVMENPNDVRDMDWNNVDVVWSEDFGQSKLSDTNWSVLTNNSNPDTADQWQNYREENTEVSRGNLKIRAKKEGAGQKKGDYSSSRISSDFAFKYGRIEIMAKLPKGEKKGIWAKLSMIGNNENQVGWPYCGEIDLMEYLSYRPNETYITVHSSANNSAKGTLITSPIDLESAKEQFHAYGLLWTENYLKFYIDSPDNITFTMNRPPSPTKENWPFDQPFYLLADLVVGGKYGGAEGVDDTMFPADLEIDYIRVYHPK